MVRKVAIIYSSAQEEGAVFARDLTGSTGSKNRMAACVDAFKQRDREDVHCSTRGLGFEDAVPVYDGTVQAERGPRSQLTDLEGPASNRWRTKT